MRPPRHDMHTASLFPAQTLEAWLADPKSAFAGWLAMPVPGEERQFAEASRDTYAAIFNRWLAHLGDMSLTEATPREAASFFAAQALEPISRRRYLQLLDRVYKHLAMLSDARVKNPLREEFKQEKLLLPDPPLCLTADQHGVLRNYLQSQPGWRGLRDRAMAALLLGAGLRTNELVLLRLAAVGVAPDYSVDVPAAGPVARHQSIILPEYRAWWQAWRDSLPVHDTACPAARSGRGFSENGVFQRVALWFEKAGLETDRVGPSVLRATFARQALTRYALEQVQQFMGHADKMTTARYLPDEMALALGVAEAV